MTQSFIRKGVWGQSDLRARRETNARFSCRFQLEVVGGLTDANRSYRHSPDRRFRRGKKRAGERGKCEIQSDATHEIPRSDRFFRGRSDPEDFFRNRRELDRPLRFGEPD